MRAREAVPWLLGVGVAVPMAAAQTSRIAWRVELPGQYVPVRPVLSPDGGTIYVVDLFGDVHAVSPGGSVRWTAVGVGNQGVDVDAAGTIYAGDESQVVALNPDGTTKWVYSIPFPRPIVAYGPVVGPDGNIFVVSSDLGERGAFSLTPAGDLRWETPVGFKPTVSWSTPVFGPNPAGTGCQMVYTSGSHLARVDCESGEVNMIGGGTAGRVVINNAGNIYFGGRGHDPDGSMLFLTANLIEAAAGNGDVYSVWGELRRLDPTDGAIIWSLNTPYGWNGNISRNPADTLLLCRGPGNAYQPPGTIRAADTQGNFLWSEDLPVDEGRVSIMGTQAVFSADGSVAYFGSSTLFQGPIPSCFLYAVQIEPAIPGDLDGDGDVDAADYAVFHGCMDGPEIPTRAGCEIADLDQDNDVDARDFADLAMSFPG